jgi:hypothetical protein
MMAVGREMIAPDTPAAAAARQTLDAQQDSFFAPSGWRCIWQSTFLAVAFGAVVFIVAGWGADEDAWTVTEWELLLAILVAQAALWGLLIPRVRDWHQDIAPLAQAAQRPVHGALAAMPYRRQSVIAAILVALAVGSIAVGAGELLEPSRINRAQWVTAAVLTVLGGLFWYQVVLVMRACYVTTRLSIFEPTVAASTELRLVIGTQRLLANRLRAVLAAVGALLTVLVFAAGAAVQVANALRRAAAQANVPPGAAASVDEIPSTVVLLFGVALSGILVLVYLPTHLRIASARQYIIDGYCPLADDAPAQSLDGRAKLAAELGEASSGFDALQRSVVIIGPLLAGLGSSFLGA